MANKWVYLFSEGDASMRNLLGGKGANLAEMTKIIGADVVPQGFTITTEACTQYYEDGRMINDDIMAQIMDGIVKMEETTDISYFIEMFNHHYIDILFRVYLYCVLIAKNTP